MSMSQNDRRALEIMENTVKLSNGHYEIGLPGKNNPPCLENNKSQAETRLQPLKRRLQRDEILRKKYTDIMDDLLRKNYAEKVTSADFISEVPTASSSISPTEARQGPGRV